MEYSVRLSILHGVCECTLCGRRMLALYFVRVVIKRSLSTRGELRMLMGDQLLPEYTCFSKNTYTPIQYDNA